MDRRPATIDLRSRPDGSARRSFAMRYRTGSGPPGSTRFVDVIWINGARIGAFFGARNAIKSVFYFSMEGVNSIRAYQASWFRAEIARACGCPGSFFRVAFAVRSLLAPLAGKAATRRQTSQTDWTSTPVHAAPLATPSQSYPWHASGNAKGPCNKRTRLSNFITSMITGQHEFRR